MTDDLDRMIDEALNTEERDLLNAIGEEPGYFTQAMGLFGGKLGWVSAVIMLAQTALFVAGVYFAWQFFHAGNTLSALQNGLPAAVLIICATQMKLTLWPSIQANRVIREVKRLELQIARERKGE